MKYAPVIRRIIELYAPDKRISAPKARLVVAQNRGADSSLEALREGCRFLLQRLLCQTSRATRANWSLHHAASGAPFLSCNGIKSSLHVSTAHSARWLAVGISKGACIGVDIEQIKPRKNLPAIASILGWQEEVRSLSDFLSKWTLWEASAKCVGGSVLARPNPEFEQLDHRYTKGRVGTAGHWAGLYDCLGKDAHYAIVLKSQHNTVLAHHHLASGIMEPW